MYSNLEIVRWIMVIGAFVCVAGAWYANTYTEYINAGIFGTISRNPYKQYVFPLAFSGVFLVIVSIVITVATSPRPSLRSVLRPVSTIPAQLVERCPYCGFALSQRVRFCPNCGRSIEPES